MAERFSENFWGGFDTLCARIYTDAKETSKELASFLVDRAAVERSYGKELMKLSTHNAGSKEIGSLRNAIFAIKADCENVGKFHEAFSIQLSKELADQLTKFKDDQKKIKKKLIADAKKAASDLDAKRNKVEPAKTRYNNANKNAEAAEEAHEKALRDRNASRGDVTKYANAVASKNKACISAEKEYREAVNQLQAVHAKYEEFMMMVFDQFQTLEEERLDFTKKLLMNYVSAQEASSPAISNGAQILKKVVGGIDKHQDIQLYIHDKRTGNMRSGVIEFVPYQRKRRDFGTDQGFAVGAGSRRGGSPRKGGGGGGGRKMKAQYAYQANEDNELSFPEGATIEILDQDESGWWQGKYQGKTGLVPSNYLA